MKDITILSGKGGTGKTSITAAIASVAKNAVFCDNDVDAADLHLLLNPEIEEEHIFQGAWVPEINKNECSNCGICKDSCRFDAIHINDEGQHDINPFQCEGCRLCERVCPEHVITSERSTNNQWYVSNTRFGKMVHARMGPGEENSGKLVTQVRKKSKEIAKEIEAEFIINDGPPGIGCSAISAITGTDLVLIVIEPTQSGLHDAIRLFELVASFNIPAYALINKSNINDRITDSIEEYLKENKIPLIAKIPFDKTMVMAMLERKTIVEYSKKSEITKQIQHVWNILVQSEVRKSVDMEVG